MHLLYLCFRFAAASLWSPTPRRATRGSTSALERTWSERGRARSQSSLCSVTPVLFFILFHDVLRFTLHFCRSNCSISLRQVGRTQCDFFHSFFLCVEVQYTIDCMDYPTLPVCQLFRVNLPKIRSNISALPPRHPSIISWPHICFQPILHPPTVSIRTALLLLSRMTLVEERSAELQEIVQGCSSSSAFSERPWLAVRKKNIEVVRFYNKSLGVFFIIILKIR